MAKEYIPTTSQEIGTQTLPSAEQQHITQKMENNVDKITPNMITNTGNISTKVIGNSVNTRFNEKPLGKIHQRGGGDNFLKIRHKKITGEKNKDVFQKYARHLARMIEYTKQNQEKLLLILEKIFKKTNKDLIINPELNEKTLSKIIEETRIIIINLYIKCEEDFQKGLQLFDNIIIETESETMNRQKEELKSQLMEALN